MSTRFCRGGRRMSMVGPLPTTQTRACKLLKADERIPEQLKEQNSYDFGQASERPLRSSLT
jgi:hypothetical protein